MKRLLPWLIVGLVIRLVLIPITLHPDIRGHNFAAYLISQKGKLFTFYDHLSNLPLTDPLVLLYHDDLFIYPPLAYHTHALFMGILSPLYPWDQFNQFILEIDSIKTSSQRLLLLYLLKLPYFIADIICLWLITKIMAEKYKFSTALLWIFNPITIYSSYMVGQFDIYIALFILLTLYLYQKNHHIWSAITLGIAAAYKPFPLFLLPFLGTSFSSKVKLTLTGLIVYIVLIAPYLGSTAFRSYALLANQSDKLFSAKILISGSQYLPLFIIGLVLLIWFNFFKPHALPLWGWFSSVLLLFYSLTHFHPQWFVWVTPILILAIISKPKAIFPAAILLLSYITIIFSFESSLNFGLFGIKYSLPFLTDQMISLVRAAFAATSICFVNILRDDG